MRDRPGIHGSFGAALLTAVLVAVGLETGPAVGSEEAGSASRVESESFYVTAGDGDNPEILDVAGDANFINGQTKVPGFEAGPDTRPASLENADLRAIWFETRYQTRKVIDTTTGQVLRVQHVPTHLLVHIRTEGPILRISGVHAWYRVPVSLPDCDAEFEFAAHASGSQHDTANIRALTVGCGGSALNGLYSSPVKPSNNGNVTTITFPVEDPFISWFISAEATVDEPSAYVTMVNSILTKLVVDEAAPGRSFTIGQDVPPDIDCTVVPEDPQCSP